MTVRLSLLDHIALALICDRAARGKQAPSLREVEAAIGSKATGTATDTLHRLQSAGLITRDSRRWRSARPTEAPAPAKPEKPPSKRLHRKARMARLAKIRSPDTVPDRPARAREPVTAR